MTDEKDVKEISAFENWLVKTRAFANAAIEAYAAHPVTDTYEKKLERIVWERKYDICDRALKVYRHGLSQERFAEWIERVYTTATDNYFDTVVGDENTIQEMLVNKMHYEEMDFAKRLQRLHQMYAEGDWK